MISHHQQWWTNFWMSHQTSGHSSSLLAPEWTNSWRQPANGL
jgi:hypothetical protein